VLFNWVHRTVDGGDHMSQFNIINNYLKPGPATPKGAEVSYRLLKPESERSKTVKNHFGQAYVNGNIVEGNEKVTKDNWDGGVQPAVSGVPLKDVLAKIKVDEPFKHAKITIEPADKAFQDVLANAGALLPKRDAVDVRVTEMVRTGNVSAKPGPDFETPFSKVGYSQEVIEKIAELVPKGIITDPSQVGGWPDYQGTPYKDSDKDGMPDDWETAHGLNPNDAEDASQESKSGVGYTNIEVFLNGGGK